MRLRKNQKNVVTKNQKNVVTEEKKMLDKMEITYRGAWFDSEGHPFVTRKEAIDSEFGRLLRPLIEDTYNAYSVLSELKRNWDKFLPIMVEAQTLMNKQDQENV